MNRKQIQKITDYIFIEGNADKKLDIAFVFGTFRWYLPLFQVVKMFENNIVSKVVFTGGINKHTGINEAKTMQAIAVELGIDNKKIVTESLSTNTLENVVLSKGLIEKNIGFKNISSIYAVVKNFHARRALMTLKKHFPENINLVSWLYEIMGHNRHNWYLSKEVRERVVREYQKIPKYLAKGDIEEL